MKTKTVLFDKTMYKYEIEEVLEYYYDGLIRWALVTYKGSPKKYVVPLYALAIKNGQCSIDFR